MSESFEFSIHLLFICQSLRRRWRLCYSVYFPSLRPSELFVRFPWRFRDEVSDTITSGSTKPIAPAWWTLIGPYLRRWRPCPSCYWHVCYCCLAWPWCWTLKWCCCCCCCYCGLCSVAWLHVFSPWPVLVRFARESQLVHCGPSVLQLLGSQLSCLLSRASNLGSCLQFLSCVGLLGRSHFASWTWGGCVTAQPLRQFWKQSSTYDANNELINSMIFH